MKQKSWSNYVAEDSTEELPEQRTRILVAVAKVEEVPEPEMLIRYFILQRLLRITRCRRWLPTCISDEIYGVLLAEELDEARLCWVIQAASFVQLLLYFKKELTLIKNSKSLPARSVLTKLSPYCDENGILRVGGRLKHALLSYDGGRQLHSHQWVTFQHQE